MSAFARIRGALLAGAAVACISLAACAPSFAQTTSGTWAQFVQLSCGVGCTDPIGFQSSAAASWSALATMGTTAYVGTTYNNSVIDASALLNAAQTVGATQLDTWLRTGDAPSQDVVNQITQALQAGAGYDVSTVTGVQTGATAASTSTASTDTSGLNIGLTNPTALASAVSSLVNSNNPAAALTQLASAFSLTGGVASDGLNLTTLSGTGTAYCNPSIAAAQNATAQTFVGNMMQVITGNGTGFTQLGGTNVGAGQSSPSGFFGSSCLSTLMNASRDTLFAPPGLGSLLSSLTSMFGAATGGAGGASSAGCGNAPPPMTQITQSNPTGIFGAAGGFLPYLGFAASEVLQAVSPQIPFATSNVSTGSTLSSLFPAPGQ